MIMRDDCDMDVIKSIIDNGGFLDRGTLTMLSFDWPNEQVIVEWDDDSRSQHSPQDALEKITMGALMGKHPNKVRLTSESLERLRGDADKPELTATEQTLVRVMPDTTLADKRANAQRVRAKLINPFSS